MTSQISRRNFHTLFGGVVGTGLFAIAAPRGARAATTEITVLNWKGYGTDEAFALKAFADATGITVKHDYFNAESEMLTKLRTNPGAYDVVLINSARIQQAQSEGLIEAIDFAAVPNAKDLAPSLKAHPNLQAGGKTYGVPWLWGMTSLGVRHGKVAQTDSWAIFSDPKICGSPRSVRRFDHSGRTRRVVDGSGHQRSEGPEVDHRGFEGDEAEREADVVQRG